MFFFIDRTSPQKWIVATTRFATFHFAGCSGRCLLLVGASYIYGRYAFPGKTPGWLRVRCQFAVPRPAVGEGEEAAGSSARAGAP